MTPAMWASLARILIQWVSVYLVSRGLISAEQAAYISDPALLLSVIGGIAAVGTAAYGVWKRRPAAMVKEAVKADPAVMVQEVAKLPDVGVIEAAPPLADKVGSPKVVAPFQPVPAPAIYEPPGYKNG
jgi:hypothetical protein